MAFSLWFGKDGSRKMCLFSPFYTGLPYKALWTNRIHFIPNTPIPFTRCHCSVVNVLASVSFEGFFFVPGEFKNGDEVCPNIFIWSNLPARTHVLTDIFLCTGEQPTWEPSHWSRGAVMMKLSQNARALSSSGWPAWNLSRILCAPVL